MYTTQYCFGCLNILSLSHKKPLNYVIVTYDRNCVTTRSNLEGNSEPRVHRYVLYTEGYPNSVWKFLKRKQLLRILCNVRII